MNLTINKWNSCVPYTAGDIVQNSRTVLVKNKGNKKSFVRVIRTGLYECVGESL